MSQEVTTRKIDPNIVVNRHLVACCNDVLLVQLKMARGKRPGLVINQKHSTCILRDALPLGIPELNRFGIDNDFDPSIAYPSLGIHV